MTSNGHPPRARVVSIFDYPEHLNPFYEDDNHNRIRFWSIGKKKSRSNSFSLSGIRNAMTLRSFRGKKEAKMSTPVRDQPEESILRSRAGGNLSRSTQSVPCAMEEDGRARGVYVACVTPNSVSRFEHDHHAQPPAQEDHSSSRLSVNSTCERISGKPPRPYRKKRRAPPPPIPIFTDPVSDISLDDESLKTELKIVEDIKPTEILITPATPEPTENIEIQDNFNSTKNQIDIELKIEEKNATAEKSSTNNEVTFAQDKNEVMDEQKKENITKNEVTDEQEEENMKKNDVTGEQDKEKITNNEVNTEMITKNILLEDEKKGESTISLHIRETYEAKNEEKKECNTEKSVIEAETADSSKISATADIDVNASITLLPSTAEIITTNDKPIPKMRTVLPNGSPGKKRLEIEEHDNHNSFTDRVEINCNETSEQTTINGETINKANAIEELEKCTKEINEILQELENSPATNLEVHHDDTNNNQMPDWSSFYRSASTVSNDKYRTVISNVQLNSSPERSLENDQQTSTLKN